MTIEDLVLKKHRVIVSQMQNWAASKIQSWWKNWINRRKRKIAPMGVWEIKRMMDKVSIIQKWWRSILLARYDRSVFVKKCKATMRVQRFIRKCQ